MTDPASSFLVDVAETTSGPCTLQFAPVLEIRTKKSEAKVVATVKVGGHTQKLGAESRFISKIYEFCNFFA